jgi:S-adenosylmethionine hydrolase
MRPVCFLSDFGLGDDFVGLCKGVILRAAPDVTIVDLTHEVPGFGIEAGAEILAHATRYMPEDAVYLAVVDPGVGTERRAVALSTEGGGCLVGPDNGLLLPAADFLGGVAEAVLLTNPDFHVHPVSATFHGRDVFSPAAAHLAAGGDLRELGDGVDPAYLIRVELPGTQRLDGGAVAVTVVGVDRYGNARLSAAQDGAGFGFGALLEIDTGDAPDSGMLVRYVETFGSSKAGDLVLVPDSHRRLSLCVNRGNAARALSLRAGDPVLLTPIEYGPRDARP